MKENTFSITIKPSKEGTELLSLSSRWNAPITVKIITPSKITYGPITYTNINVEQKKQ